MKKVIALLLALVVCLGLCACGGEDAQMKADAEKYNEYKDLIDKIEAGDFSGAYSDFVGRFPEQEVSAPTIDAGDITLDGVVIGTPDTESTVTAVEITMDNWQEYFEIVYSEKWETNGFGEATSLWMRQSLQLKDAYKDRVTYGSLSESGYTLKMSEVTVEYRYNQTYYDITVDFTNQSYQKGGLSSENGYSGGEKTSIQTHNFYPNGASATFVYCSIDESEVMYNPSMTEWDSIEVLRIQGTLYLKDE